MKTKHWFSKPLIFCAVFTLFLAFAVCSVGAVPASPDPFYFTQPNGDVITLYSRGDEWLSWVEDEDGNLVTYEQGYYYYATWTNEGPAATNLLVSEAKSLEDMKTTSPSSRISAGKISKGEDIPEAVLDRTDALMAKYANHMASPSYSSGIQTFNEPNGTTGRTRANDDLQRPVLVVYVTWPNREGLEDIELLSEEEIADRFFGEDDSVNDYYQEVFGYGDEDVIVPAYPESPVFTVTLDGREWCDLARWQAIPGWASEDDDFFWVPNTDKHWNSLEWRGATGDDANKASLGIWMMFAALYEAQEQHGIDIGDFKNHDGDTMLYTSELSITFVFDGYEGAYSINGASSSGGELPGFWASALTIGVPNMEFGEKGVSVWSMFGQSSHLDADIPFVIGTAAHELGHSGFGYKDLYSYGTKAGLLGLMMHQGVGYWSLMDQGAWSSAATDDGSFELLGTSPCYVDAYNLILGDCVDPVILSHDQIGTYNPVSHLDLYAVVPNGQPMDLSGQYFVLQQRSNIGYDRATFSNIAPVGKKADDVGGLLLMHVDENVRPANNRINDKATHMRASVKEAHGGTQHLSTEYLLGLGPNSGELLDLYGNGKSRFSMVTDPNSALFGPYTDNTTAPARNINSEVIIYDMEWDGSTGTSTFSIPDISDLYGIEIFTAPESLKANQTSAANRTIKAVVTGYELAGKKVQLYIGVDGGELEYFGEQEFIGASVGDSATFSVHIPAIVKGTKTDTIYTLAIAFDEDDDGEFEMLPEFTRTLVACGEPEVLSITPEISEYPYYGAQVINPIILKGSNLNYGIQFRPLYSNSSTNTTYIFDRLSAVDKTTVMIDMPAKVFPANLSKDPFDVYVNLSHMGNVTLGIIVSNTFNTFACNTTTVTVAGRPGITEVIPADTVASCDGGTVPVTLKGVNNLLTNGIEVSVIVSGDGFEETFPATIIDDETAEAEITLPQNLGDIDAEYTISAKIKVPYPTGNMEFTEDASATVSVERLLCIEEVNASNGQIVYTYNRIPTLPMPAEDFSLLYTVNGIPAGELEITAFDLTDNILTVDFTAFEKTTENQDIVIDLVYNGISRATAQIFIPQLEDIASVKTSASALTTIQRNKSFTVTANIFNSDEGVASITWKASNPSIVTLEPSEDGKSVVITGVKAGMITVTCTVTSVYGTVITAIFAVKVV